MKLTLEVAARSLEINMPGRRPEVDWASGEWTRERAGSRLAGRLEFASPPEVLLHEWSTVLTVADQLDAEYPILRWPEARRRFEAKRPDETAVIVGCALKVFDRSSRIMEVFTPRRPDFADFLKTQVVLYYLCHFAAEDGILLHGSGFVLEGLAGAVVGPSGAGKSTAASLLSGGFLLSDDVVVATDLGGVPMLHSTPLGHLSDGRDSAPLRALFFPKKAQKFSVDLMSPREATLRYLSEHGCYISQAFQPFIGPVFMLAHEMFSKVPSYELSFPLEYVDSDAIRGVLSRPLIGRSRLEVGL